MGKKTIVFDANARKEFITGFHKRKTERRQRSRQKIAERVRQERIESRRQKREWLRQQNSVTTSHASIENAGTTGIEISEQSESSTYEFRGMVATTIVAPLLQEDETSLVEARSQSSGTNKGDGAPRPKPKKFNLQQPLATAIPGYRPPKHSSAKRKKAAKGTRKRGPIGKKEKAKNRAAARQKTS
eukprot:CAMPEP_0119313762 /NCGR_PEP_ID=MMETSP1333-20130426/30302_1 /TAXON_ID=418940 /ORGANISM="Scyphosphaera apsteinii, Strain RCC1455" /LENGTH=185 /DNA_ID=CAMNT_0007318691 /DNA_START=41 /DNA_END=598 /DNA_ORIENTATION=+